MKTHKPTKVARSIYKALEELGGEGTTSQIAAKSGFSNNSVSVSLGAMTWRYVECLGGQRTNIRLRNEVRWKITAPMP